MTGRLIPPEKSGATPQKAQWLSGEGGGAWFYIRKSEKNFCIKRYTPEGIIDCDRLFNLRNSGTFDEDKPFEIQHISHGAEVRVVQDSILYIFKWIQE